MNHWQMLGTLVKTLVLMEVLLGKEVTKPDGTSLGTAADIELDLMQDKTWVMVKHQEHWSRIPSEQIANLNDKLIFLEQWLPPYMESEAGPSL